MATLLGRAQSGRTYRLLVRTALALGVVAAAVAAWTLGPTTAAQDPAPAVKTARIYTNKRVIRVPIYLDDKLRAGLREVQLHVRESPTLAWTVKQVARPDQAYFTYQADQDGEYGFYEAAVDRAGKVRPLTGTAESPGWVVVVDTVAPRADLRALPGADETLVECQVVDENREGAKVVFEYQLGDKSWRKLDPVPGAADTYSIPRQAVTTGQVRVALEDRAGNKNVVEANVSALPVSVAGTPRLTPTPTESSAPSPSLLPPAVTSNIQPVSAVSSAPNTPAPSTMPTIARKSRWLLNTRHVSLAYQVDASGHGDTSNKVEAWITSDQGQTWQPAGSDPAKRGALEVDLPGDGLFGVSLVVGTPRTPAKPPARGDKAEWWVEVDTMPPVAQLLVQGPAGRGPVSVCWTAQDKNLAAEPIDLYYAATRTGPWHPIAHGIKNTGKYEWTAPREAGAQCYVRLMVHDTAGNTCVCETPEPVQIEEIPPPQARVLNVMPRAAGGDGR